MNQRQQEQVESLGRAFQEAISEIISLGYNDPEPPLTKRVLEEEDEVVPDRIRDLNDGLASHDVTITQVHNGFVVQAGCQRFVFETFDKMTKYMKMYYDDPIGTYVKHSSGELFGK